MRKLCGDDLGAVAARALFFGVVLLLLALCTACIFVEEVNVINVSSLVFAVMLKAPGLIVLTLNVGSLGPNIPRRFLVVCVSVKKTRYFR